MCSIVMVGEPWLGQAGQEPEEQRVRGPSLRAGGGWGKPSSGLAHLSRKGGRLGPHLSWTPPSAFPISAPGKGKGCLQPPNGHCHPPGPGAHKPERCVYTLGSHMGVCTQSCRWCFLTGRHPSLSSPTPRSQGDPSRLLRPRLSSAHDSGMGVRPRTDLQGFWPVPASLQPHWPPGYSRPVPGSLLPPGFGPGCSLCLEAPLQTCTQPHLPRVPALCHLASEAFSWSPCHTHLTPAPTWHFPPLPLAHFFLK